MLPMLVAFIAECVPLRFKIFVGKDKRSVRVLISSQKPSMKQGLKNFGSMIEGMLHDITNEKGANFYKFVEHNTHDESMQIWTNLAVEGTGKTKSVALDMKITTKGQTTFEQTLKLDDLIKKLDNKVYMATFAVLFKTGYVSTKNNAAIKPILTEIELENEVKHSNNFKSRNSRVNTLLRAYKRRKAAVTFFGGTSESEEPSTSASKNPSTSAKKRKDSEPPAKKTVSKPRAKPVGTSKSAANITKKTSIPPSQPTFHEPELDNISSSSNTSSSSGSSSTSSSGSSSSTSTQQ